MPTLGPLVRAGSRPISVGLSSRNGSEILLNTMQLVEPRKQKNVPNHLLETKIYSKVGKSAAIQTRPSTIHFDGFEVHKKHVRTFQIVNASPEVLRMHIIPPQSKYFYIKYKKSERMVPGLTLECTIEFTPDEWRYYYDCVRINCPGEENLVVPLHAYPVMSTKDFPQHYSFPAVPVGDTLAHVFPLYCSAPIDFEFHITYIQPNVAFHIEPMSGIVPANSHTDVAITFSPREFHTAQIKIQLTISQFNSKPIICTFTGHSVPGLLKELTEKTYVSEFDNVEILDPRCLSPLDRARSKRKTSGSKRSIITPKKEIVYQGVKFPAHIDTPHAVAQVLNQEPGKIRAKDLRESIVTKKDANKSSNRQMKEAQFEHDVRQNVYEERQNQLRWQVRLGDVHISNKTRSEILDARSQAWEDYKYNKRGDCVPETEFQRTSTSLSFKRTLRDADHLASSDTKFDTYTNDMWASRHAALNMFRQAGRKLIIRARASHKLKSLRRAMIDWSKKKFAVKSLVGDQLDKLDEEEEREEVALNLELSSEKVKTFTFPTYVPPNIKDDMAPDALGVVPFKPTEVFIKRKTPYFNLKVPHHYKLLGYKKHDVQTASMGYISPKLTRPLRTGAEDEVINLTASVTEPVSDVGELVDEGDMTLVDVTDTPQEGKDKTKIQSLSPPEALFKPIVYPALHIFNPAPGLQVFQAPIPYAEVDPDFHLCPLPRYVRKDHATNPHASTQRRYLDREDVVRGVMGWKKFPSQGLTSLSNTPTLTAVWVPRWDDQFDDDLLPVDVPPLFDGLPEDDQENVEEEDGGESRSRQDGIALTPEMVNAQFAVVEPERSQSEEKVSSEMFPFGNKMPAANIPVGNNGPVPRHKREEELDYFMTKKYNRLGAKIQAKTASLNNMVSNPDLLLQ